MTSSRMDASGERDGFAQSEPYEEASGPANWDTLDRTLSVLRGRSASTYGSMSRSGLPGAERKVSMTVLKQHHAPGMPAEVYDQVATGAMPSQSKADGFVAHYAIVEGGGITVIEIWDSIDQHDAWFNEVVKPHLPPDTPEPKFAELHNSNAK
jgi:hypothetical protein